ncbi:MAG: glucosyl-3-phosphoglycerate synthase [Actinomycetota bacterium]|nr:glucosyl-3-phosphoglycerate synthase [Actinomycetota bacterium]
MEGENWLRKRTFKHEDFECFQDLLREKERQGLRISVCLPTLNEEETVGQILAAIREVLIEKVPLVDELAIVDSRSSDSTVEIARREGARVIFDDEILPGMPTASGKGEALWKSLYALEGDIVCWIDSDIRNFHSRFVYGLVGPLLSEPEIGYVKAFYRRPLREGGVLYETGGGRITECVVRPLLSLFYPELCGIVQPLSGEYAGRREILESVPFFSGYGVEIGLLIDIYKKFGLNCIAQVNMDTREHFNQSIEALGRMSFGIMKAFLRRLSDEGKVKLESPLHSEYNAMVYTGREPSIEEVKIDVIERPPLMEIPEYRNMRRRLEGKS